MQRIIDLSDSPAKLRVKNKQLIISRDAGAETAPLAEIVVLVVAHRQVTFTQAVLSGLVDAGGVFVTCNEQLLPTGMLLPLAGHFAQVERFAAQASASLPTKKRLWQQIIRGKIRSQANALEMLHGDDAGLKALMSQVQSGDPKNVEARAARRYWPSLFIDQAFRRDRDQTGANAALNYGYAVLRAITARAICAAGLHPSLGVHHHNKYSMYPLADDLMEPLRPIVDVCVARLLADGHDFDRLTPASKRPLLEMLLDRYLCEGESRSLFDIAARMASSVADVFMTEQQKMLVPELLAA